MLGACKIDNFILSFQGDTSVVVPIVLSFGVEFLCCLHFMYIFICIVKFG